MAVRKWLKRGAIACGLIVASTDIAYAMAVYDAANFIENQAAKLKLTEQLQYVINTYNEINRYVQWVGNVSDMAQNFTQQPERLINEVTNCLNSQTNTTSNTVCGKQFNIDQNFFTHATGGGAVSDVAMQSARDHRETRLVEAVKRGLALPDYLRSDGGSTGQALVNLAAEAQSPTSGSAQANITNKLLVELVRQMQLANTIAAASLELQAAQAVKAIPVVVGTSNARFGLR